MPTPKKFNLIKTKEGNINIDETLFQQRNLFLHSSVTDAQCDMLIAELLILDKMSQEPIYLHVNSPGGYVSWGFALIDVMNSIKSKVITVGSGCIASMGTVIFISAKERTCHKNTEFMLHDIYAGVSDYGAKMEARVDFQKKSWLLMVDHIRKHTKLSEKELEYMRSGELWLSATDAKAKGLVDKII